MTQAPTYPKAISEARNMQCLQIVRNMEQINVSQVRVQFWRLLFSHIAAG